MLSPPCGLRDKSRSPQGGDNNAVPPFNHQEGVCGADVIAPDEVHHTMPTAVAMCALRTLLRTEAALKRPGGPREELGLTPQRKMTSPQGRTALLASPGDSVHLAARGGSLPRGLPRRSHLGLGGICIPVRTGPMTDRSMGTLVPTGPTKRFRPIPRIFSV